MAQVGHVLIGTGGQFLSTDAAFCAILKSDPSAILGRLVLDVTAPADRPECAQAIRQLRETGRPFVIVKRCLQADGALIWVKNSVSIALDADGPPMIVATIEPVAEPMAHHSPAMLLEAARHMVTSLQRRAEVCDPELLAGSAWDIILAAYIGEAEGRAIDIAGMAAALHYPVSTTERWVKLLVQNDVLEIEFRWPDPDAPKSFRLASRSHAKLERYLSRMRAPQSVES